MFKYRFWIVLSVFVLAVSLAACSSGESTEPASSPAEPPSSAVNTPAPSAPPQAAGRVVTIANQDTGGSGAYEFVPSELTFKAGETINFEMSAETEFHTFTIDELEIDEEIDGGKTVTFSFTFDQPGTFRYFCIPHEAFGMEGTIVVE